MKVGGNYVFLSTKQIPPEQGHKTIPPAPTSVPPEKPLAATAAGAKPSAAPDFTSATRASLLDWMNAQIRSGKMSLQDSTPFLGMTLNVTLATEHAVPATGDSERIDFIERARDGISGAAWRKDADAVKRWQFALDAMLGARSMI